MNGNPLVADHVTRPPLPAAVSGYFPLPSTVAQTSVVTPVPVSGCVRPRSISAWTPALQSTVVK
jgi:hypothetical protein